MKPGPAGDPRLAWACRAVIVLAIAGVFGTWRSSGEVSLDGLQGPHNGWLVVIFGVIALAGVGATARGAWVGIVLVIGCGAVMAFTAIENIVDDEAVVGGSSGWGVWVTVLASVALTGAAVLAAVRRLRP